MRKIVPVQQREEIISKSILGRKDIMRDKIKKLSGRKNGSFLEESSLKEKLQKSALYVENQVILRKLSKKGKSSKTS